MVQMNFKLCIIINIKNEEKKGGEPIMAKLLKGIINILNQEVKGIAIFNGLSSNFCYSTKNAFSGLTDKRM